MAAMTKLTCVLVVVVLTVAPPLSNAAMTCNNVVSSLTPCVDYIRNNGNMAVPTPCCAGINSLNSQANNTPDRQTVCKCLKTVAANFPNVNPSLAAGLPGKCGVNLPYKIDPSTDCAKVQ